MLVHLGRQFPTALNLRRVLASQRALTHGVIQLVPSDAPALIDTWSERERTYAWLGKKAQQLGGVVGNGGVAAAESANAVGRLRLLGAERLRLPGLESLRELNSLFMRADARIAGIIEQGVAERLYFVSAKVPRLIEASGKAVSPVRKRYAPVTSPDGASMLSVVRQRLSPVSAARKPARAGESRQQLHEALEHQPTQRHRGPRP